MSDQVNTKLVEVLVPWRAELIPRGCRNLRPVCVGETIHVAIRAPAPDEARIAFRISCKYLRQKNIPPGGRTQVVHCDGALWWPISPSTEDVRSPDYRSPVNEDKYIDALRLERCLALGTHDLLALRSDQAMDHEFLVPFHKLPIVRVWKEDNRIQNSALAQRRVSENLMIWKGQAYARAGEPTYVQPPPEQWRFQRWGGKRRRRSFGRSLHRGNSV